MRIGDISDSVEKPFLPLPSKDYLLECLSYDPGGGVLVWLERPARHFASPKIHAVRNAKFAGRTAGTIHCQNGRPIAVVVKLDGRRLLAHRVIWKIMTGADPPNMIDHRNLDPTDNKWDNLRSATRSQNRCNSLGQGRSGIKGVQPAPSGRWQAYIQDGNKNYLGTFPTVEEAQEAYASAASRLHGEFANIGHRSENRS